MTEDDQKRYSLAEARKSVGLSQNRLKDLANVSKGVIVNCEAGKAILKLTADQLLRTINNERIIRGMIPIEQSQMNWKLREYKREEKEFSEYDLRLYQWEYGGLTGRISGLSMDDAIRKLIRRGLISSPNEVSIHSVEDDY